MSDELNPLDPSVQWIVTEARRPVAIDPDARRRLLDAISAEAVPRHRSPFHAWLLEPRRSALPPIATIALAAGLVGIGVIAGFAFDRDGRVSTEQRPAVVAVPQLPDSIAPRAVRFVLIAPQAARVSVVGDFNGWDNEATPAVRQPDGTWTTYVPLRPGRHVYSFIVDGKHFVNDPAAPIAPDDGYGQKNVMLVVPGASS